MLFLCKERSWTRCKHIITSKLSMLRTMQYESLATVSLSGLCLDVGGGEVTDYRHIFKMDGVLESVNIDPDRKPTYIHDLNKSWPMDNNKYDGILSLNTFEHIYNDVFALKEMMRVLKPGGVFHIMVPYLYRVHGSPCDYNRHTIFWWADYMKEIGADDGSIVIEQHSWERVANSISIINFKVFGINLRALILPLYFLREFSRKVRGLKIEEPIEENPVGYYIRGRKTTV